MTTAAILLRIASVVALLEAIGHTFLFATYVPTHGPAEIAVVEAMKSHSFRFGFPTAHSYWELYFGYGLFVAVSCLIQAGVLWQIAASPIRSIVALFFVGELGYATLMWKYFLLVPIVSHSFMALCLAAAFLAMSETSESRSVILQS